MQSIATNQVTPDFSIIICTFNPDEHLFVRTLQAVASLNLNECITVECIVVDNNSSPEVAQFRYVQQFLLECPWAKVIKEPQQGLTYARIAGIKAASAPILVFFDDDNEPEKNYLVEAQHYFASYPGVAIWGPGKVQVEFVDPVPDWFKEQFSKYFQAKMFDIPTYGASSKAHYEPYYPPGTGHTGYRFIFDQYISAVEDGRLNAVGRQGKSLSSAEDIQIVWEATKLGYSAGVAPNLIINHLIPAKRSTIGYVKRLTFGTASSYNPALADSFPETREQIALPGNFKIFVTLIKITLNYKLWLQPGLLMCNLANYLGAIVGIMRVNNIHDRQWIYRLVKWLELE